MTESTDTTTTIAAVTRRDVVRVAGPDAATYLQGQISQDVDALAVNTSTWTFILQPQGKVDAWARITKVSADEFLLDIDHGHGEALEARLNRFKIRTKADVELVEWPMVSVRGSDAPHGELPDSCLRLPAVGPDVEGYDILGPDAAVPEGVREVGAGALEADRVLHGVPAMGSELGADTIPAEIGQWIIDASVSFTKGCFVGQELVARIDSRGGNVPRRLRAVVLDQPVELGAPVLSAGPDTSVTSVAVGDRQTVALAFLGRKVAVGDTVDVAGVSGVVHELPLSGASAG